MHHPIHVMYFISVYSFLPFSLQRNRTHNRNEKEKKKKKMNERMFHAFVCLVCVNYMAMKIPPDILINFIAVDVDRACEQREERNEDRTSDAGWLCYCCAPFLSLLTMCDCGVSCSFGGESLSLSSGISFVQFRCGAAMRSRSAIRCYGMRTYLWRNHIVRCANGRFEFLVLCNSMRDFIENAQ